LERFVIIASAPGVVKFKKASASKFFCSSGPRHAILCFRKSFNIRRPEMELNRPALKTEARRLIDTSKPSPILVGLVLMLITYVLNSLSLKLTGIQMDPTEYQNAIMNGTMAEYVQSIFRNYHPGAAAVILDAAIRIMLLMLSAGFTIFVLNTVRHYKAGYGNLFDSFGIFFKLLWLFILEYLFIILWTLLLVVPGIIAAYKYRMALYLMLDNPEMSAMQCISESKKMMSGHKWELFVLDLSFIGWYILEIIPFVSIWVEPYTQLTYGVYYNTLRGMLGYALPAGESVRDDDPDTY